MGPILERLRESEDKGKLLEKVVERALQDLGFQNVRRQLSGSQFGFDIVALRKSERGEPGEVWKFECKNLKVPITVNDIAPKLIWNFGRSVIEDRKSTRLNSSHVAISYAVFCLKKKKKN